MLKKFNANNISRIVLHLAPKKYDEFRTLYHLVKNLRTVWICEIKTLSKSRLLISVNGGTPEHFCCADETEEFVFDLLLSDNQQSVSINGQLVINSEINLQPGSFYLIGRPFFGKSLSSFAQYWDKSLVGDIKSINIEENLEEAVSKAVKEAVSKDEAIKLYPEGQRGVPPLADAFLQTSPTFDIYRILDFVEESGFYGGIHENISQHFSMLTAWKQFSDRRSKFRDEGGVNVIHGADATILYELARIIWKASEKRISNFISNVIADVNKLEEGCSLLEIQTYFENAFKENDFSRDYEKEIRFLFKLTQHFHTSTGPFKHRHGFLIWLNSFPQEFENKLSPLKAFTYLKTDRHWLTLAELKLVSDIKTQDEISIELLLLTFFVESSNNREISALYFVHQLKEIYRSGNLSASQINLLTCFAAVFLHQHNTFSHASHAGEIRTLVWDICEIGIQNYTRSDFLEDEYEFALGILGYWAGHFKFAKARLTKSSRNFSASAIFLSSIGWCLGDAKGSLERFKAEIQEKVQLGLLNFGGKSGDLVELENPTIRDYCHWLLWNSKSVFKLSDIPSDEKPAAIEPNLVDLFYVEPGLYVSKADFKIALKFKIRPLSDETSVVRLADAFDVRVNGNSVRLILFKDSHPVIHDFVVDDLFMDRPNELIIERVSGEISLTLNDDVHKFNIPPHLGFRGSTFVVPCGVRTDLFVTHLTGWLCTAENFTKPETIILYSSWYGDEFTQNFYESLLPSLQRPTGLPSLSKNFKIQWRIYTTYEQVPSLKSNLSKIPTDFVDEVFIDCGILGSEKSDPRQILYKSLVDVNQKALETNAIILMAPPDHIFGDGLTDTILNMEPGEYLICGHPRVSKQLVNSTAAYNKLSGGLNGAPYRNNRQMAHAAVNSFPHSVVEFGLGHRSDIEDGVEPSNWWHGKMVGATKTEVYFKEPPPLAFYPSHFIDTILTGDGFFPPFERIDHDIVEWFNRLGRLKTIDDNKTFFWAEYCLDSRNNPTIRNNWWSPVARKLLNKRITWDLEP